MEISLSEKLNGKKFREIVERIQDLIFVNDFQGNFLYMNPAGLKILGYTEQELSGMNYLDIFPEQYKNEAFDFYSAQLKYGLGKTYREIPILCKDKTMLWVGQNVIRVEENGQVFFHGLARDITDRLKVEEALKESEEKYRTILEDMEECYFEVDLEGNLTFFNKSLCDLIGRFTMEEFRSMNYCQVMDEKNAEHVFMEFHEVFTTGKSREIKYTVITGGSVERRLESWISPIRDRTNNIKGFSGIARDVTDREKMLEDLKNSLSKAERSEEKYRLLAENITDIIWVLDIGSLKFTYISPAIETVRGFTVEEGMVEKLDSAFPQDELSRVFDILHDEMEKDKTGEYDPDRRITFEARQLKKNGSQFWAEITSKFIRDSSGRPVAVQGSTRDISHRKKVEFERDKFAENLAAARIVQQGILPQKPPSSDLVNIAFRYLPMEEVGGDYFTFIEFREHNSLGLFIGDVSGHGVPAALYTMMVKAITDRLFRKYSLNPSRFLEELNHEISLAMSSNFLTGIYGLFSYGDTTGSIDFNFSKGGHPYPLYYNQGRKDAEYIESRGKPLGFFENEKFPNRVFTINRGDRLYFYTDGLVEVTDDKKEIYGFERFQELVKEANSRDRSLDGTLDYILNAVINYNPMYMQEDDMVIIGIEVR